MLSIVEKKNKIHYISKAISKYWQLHVSASSMIDYILLNWYIFLNSDEARPLETKSFYPRLVKDQ
jgi:hypothetical protein